MRDVVPGLGGVVRPHGVLRHRLVVGDVAAERGVHALPARLADVVQHAAGAQHHGEVLQLHLRALLQARPPALEAREGVDGDAPDLRHLLVEGVLRPRQVGLRVGRQHPLREREAGAAHHPGPRHHPGRRALLQRRPLQHLVVGHGPGPPDADVGEGAVGAHHTLERDGVGRLVVALRVPPVEVGRHRRLGRDDGDVGGVDGAHHPRDPGLRLEPGLERVGGGGVGPAEEARHQEATDGGAHLQDQLVAGGDAEAEALGHEAERLPRGEPPHAHRHALPDRDGGAERRVLLGHGGAQRVAEHREGGPPHPEGGAEVRLRVVGAAALIPPRARPVLDPQPPLLVRAVAVARGGERGRRRRPWSSSAGHLLLLILLFLFVVPSRLLARPAELEEGELRARGVVDVQRGEHAGGGPPLVAGLSVGGVPLVAGAAALTAPVRRRRRLGHRGRAAGNWEGPGWGLGSGGGGGGSGRRLGSGPQQVTGRKELGGAGVGEDRPGLGLELGSERSGAGWVRWV